MKRFSAGISALSIIAGASLLLARGSAGAAVAAGHPTPTLQPLYTGAGFSNVDPTADFGYQFKVTSQTGSSFTGTFNKVPVTGKVNSGKISFGAVDPPSFSVSVKASISASGKGIVGTYTLKDLDANGKKYSDKGLLTLSSFFVPHTLDERVLRRQ